MSLKLGKEFYKSSLGTFYFDPETYEVTIQVENQGRVYHEHRTEGRTLIGQFAKAIDAIQEVL